MSETTVEEQRELLEQALFEIKRVIAGRTRCSSASSSACSRAATS